MELVLGCGLQTVCTPYSPTTSPQLVPRNTPHLGNAVPPAVITNAQASQEISPAPPSSVVLINTILGTSTPATTTFPSTAPSLHTQLCALEASHINLIFGSRFYRSSKPSSHTRTQLSVTPHFYPTRLQHAQPDYTAHAASPLSSHPHDWHPAACIHLSVRRSQRSHSLSAR
jgi:hypothetical protein